MYPCKYMTCTWAWNHWMMRIMFQYYGMAPATKLDGSTAATSVALLTHCIWNDHQFALFDPQLVVNDTWSLKLRLKLRSESQTQTQTTLRVSNSETTLTCNSNRFPKKIIHFLVQHRSTSLRLSTPRLRLRNLLISSLMYPLHRDPLFATSWR